MKFSRNCTRNTEMSSELLPTKCVCAFGYSFALTDYARHICNVEALRAIYGPGMAQDRPVRSWIGSKSFKGVVTLTLFPSATDTGTQRTDG